MIGTRKLARYGRKKNSGQAALATHGDGWRKLARYQQRLGPFDGDPIRSPCPPRKAAEIAFDHVKRTDT